MCSTRDLCCCAPSFSHPPFLLPLFCSPLLHSSFPTKGHTAASFSSLPARSIPVLLPRATTSPPLPSHPARWGWVMVLVLPPEGSGPLRFKQQMQELYFHSSSSCSVWSPPARALPVHRFPFMQGEPEKGVSAWEWGLGRENHHHHTAPCACFPVPLHWLLCPKARPAMMALAPSGWGPRHKFYKYLK